MTRSTSHRLPTAILALLAALALAVAAALLTGWGLTSTDSAGATWNKSSTKAGATWNKVVAGSTRGATWN